MKMYIKYHIIITAGGNGARRYYNILPRKEALVRSAMHQKDCASLLG